MLFSYKQIGLELFKNGISFVQAAGSSATPHIEQYDIVKFSSDVIRPSLKELNVTDRSLLKSTIQESYSRSLSKSKRISLSIPDAAGKVLLLNLDTPFRTKDEGIDHVRWKLKKSFPLDLNDIHLDFQILDRSDTGSSTLLVGLLSLAILQEYEELILEAGLEPVTVDFSSFNLYRLFASRLDSNEYLTFISLYRGSFSLMVYLDGVLDFFRNKFISTDTCDPARLYREVNSSLLVYSDMKGGWKPKSMHFFATGEEKSILRNVILEVIGTEPVAMDTDLFCNTSRQHIDRSVLPDVLSALGAASRGLR